MKKKKGKKSNKKFFILFFIFIITPCLILSYSHYIGTKGIITNEYKIKYEKLNNDFYGLKIVHISDIHYGKTITDNDLKNLINKVNKTKPDIVVFTGDLINQDTTLSDKEKQKISDILSEIDSNIGVYAIRGDHDNNDDFKLIMNNANIIDLNDTYDLIYKNSNESILLAGLSSNMDNDNIEAKMASINEYMNSNNPKYSILIMHEPDFIDKFDYSKFNLILAGHSLNGQINIPLIGGILKPKYAKKYYQSHYQLKNTTLYISSGMGVEKYSFRLFNRPSFNLYRLTN